MAAKKAKKKKISTKKRAKAKKPKHWNAKDPASQYARSVLRDSRPVVAGPYVRDACRRHFRDLEEQKERGIFFDVEAGIKACQWFEKYLKLASGEFEGKPFKLCDWQKFVICSLFGWKWARWKGNKPEPGYRRFGKAYIETGKGSGKSPLAAGVGLRLMMADAEPRAEIYAVATMRDQAMVLFRDAIAMYEQSDQIFERLKATGAKGREWNLYYPKTGAFFRPIGSDTKAIGKSGFKPHANLFDEIHEHPTNAMIEFMSMGKKARRQALDFMITNSGHDRQSVCYEYHEYGIKIAAGSVQDDSFFAYICALDEGDNPFKSERCWKKANPSLPVTPGMAYLRTQVREARGMPSKESIVRRLNFCEWVGAENPWISQDSWQNIVKAMEFPAERLACVAAIDLSGKLDLTSLSLLFPDMSEKITIETKIVDGEENYIAKDYRRRQAFNWYWTPKDTLKEREQRDRAPYSVWVRDGHLIAVPGKSIDYRWVAFQIKELSERFDLRILAFDRYRIDDLIREMDELGIECYKAEVAIDAEGLEAVVPKEGSYAEGIAMLPHGQGYKDMSPAVEGLEEVILNEIIEVQENPVTTMCAANAVIEQDAAENKKFTKKKSTGRIDGMVSLAMGNRTVRLLDSVDLGGFTGDLRFV